MGRLSEAGRWLSEAEWDLATAEDLLGLKRFNAASFYAQQAAEKAVRAVLFSLGDIPIGHSVKELFRALRAAYRLRCRCSDGRR